MLYKANPFDKLDTQMSALGQGIMRFSDVPAHMLRQQSLFDHAMRNGVNYFECSPFYNNNRCEDIVGMLLSSVPRYQYILTDKYPVACYPQEQIDLVDYVRGQLRRTLSPFFDFYLLQHTDRHSIDIIRNSDMRAKLDELKRLGLVKYVGFSYHDTAERIDEILDLYDWDVVQIQLNYVDFFINDNGKIYEKITARGIPVFVMGACKGGNLAHGLPKNVEAVFDAADLTKSYASWAMRFPASFPNVQMVLGGTTTMNDLRDNLETFETAQSLYMHDEDLDLYRRAAMLYKDARMLNCTQCGYCNDVCPNGVEFRPLFRYYNALLKQYDPKVKEAYAAINTDDSRNFIQCVRCGECMRRCPQKLNIPELVSYLGQFYR